MATPHIGAEPGDIAETIICAGDPKRAEMLADRYLQDWKQFNDVRGIFGATGTYHGKRISVMAHGMGVPSIGIYSYELFKFFDVQNFIRIGTSGTMQPHVKIRDVVIGMGACTDSEWQYQYGIRGHFAPIASYDLLRKSVDKAAELGVTTHVGNIFASDIFYNEDETVTPSWVKLGVLAVEMEASSLYMNAARLGRNALCMLTITDSLVPGDTTPHLTAEERQKSLTDMMDIAFGVAEQL